MYVCTHVYAYVCMHAYICYEQASHDTNTCRRRSQISQLEIVESILVLLALSLVWLHPKDPQRPVVSLMNEGRPWLEAACVLSVCKTAKSESACILKSEPFPPPPFFEDLKILCYEQRILFLMALWFWPCWCTHALHRSSWHRVQHSSIFLSSRQIFGQCCLESRYVFCLCVNSSECINLCMYVCIQTFFNLSLLTSDVWAVLFGVTVCVLYLRKLLCMYQFMCVCMYTNILRSFSPHVRCLGSAVWSHGMCFVSA